MNMRSGQTYGEQPYTQQQRDDALFGLVEKFGDLCGAVSVLSKWVDHLWENSSSKPDGSGEGEKDMGNEDAAKSSTGEPDDPRNREEQPLNTMPHHYARHTPRTHAGDYHRPHNPYLQWEQPTHMGHRLAHGRRDDNITKQVRVDVSDFHGKLDPCAFQNWLTALEDYFEWFDLSPDRKGWFVKMKLKGPAHVWWQSVEEYHRRSAITTHLLLG
jgi:hypothetical protein